MSVMRRISDWNRTSRYFREGPLAETKRGLCWAMDMTLREAAAHYRNWLCSPIVMIVLFVPSRRSQNELQVAPLQHVPEGAIFRTHALQQIYEPIACS
jgi:hypothetical protein